MLATVTGRAYGAAWGGGASAAGSRRPFSAAFGLAQRAWSSVRGAHAGRPGPRRLRWMEFVRATDDSQGEVRRFYERQGGYLAILYALEATDFTRENLIADGERPVLLDLETHPAHARVRCRRRRRRQLAWRSIALEGLLPQAIHLQADPTASISAVSVRSSGQVTPHWVPLRWSCQAPMDALCFASGLCLRRAKIGRR